MQSSTNNVVDIFTGIKRYCLEVVNQGFSIKPHTQNFRMCKKKKVLSEEVNKERSITKEC